MNFVLIAAWLLAVVSAIFIHPDAAYMDYIDFHTLGLLFCLMTVMAGLNRLGLFAQAAQKMLSSVKNSRQLELILVLLCFFSSMVITNDVALITFVPFALQVLNLAGQKKSLIPVVTLQTVAANLGSMLTPIGNPQNLYLYSQSGMGLGQFLLLMLPLAALAAALIVILIFVRKKVPLEAPVSLEKTRLKSRGKAVMYGLLFLLCLCCVARILPVWVMVLLTLAAVLATDRRTLRHVDYSLLLTFVGFFIFIGNMGRIEAFCSFLKNMVDGHEVLTSVLSSQVISNVPAALLLSGFTSEWEALIIGTNIGGLGTLIASMASLISYRLVTAAIPKERGRYIGCFTAVNAGFLAVLLGAAFLLYR